MPSKGWPADTFIRVTSEFSVSGYSGGGWVCATPTKRVVGNRPRFQESSHILVLLLYEGTRRSVGHFSMETIKYGASTHITVTSALALFHRSCSSAVTVTGKAVIMYLFRYGIIVSDTS
jgi:hypothetical protein